MVKGMGQLVPFFYASKFPVLMTKVLELRACGLQQKASSYNFFTALVPP
jgi:hypothetical protein